MNETHSRTLLVAAWILVVTTFSAVFVSLFMSGAMSFWLPTGTGIICGLLMIALYFLDKRQRR